MDLSTALVQLAQSGPHGGAAALDLLLVLATAGAVALLFARLKLPSVPGYLIAGAIIGPSAVGLIRDADAVASLGQLSTVILLFLIGLHLDMSRVRTGMLSIVGVSTAATLAMALFAWPAAYVFTGSATSALAVAMAMSIAATAVPLKTLEERREMNSAHGRLAFGFTLFQDLLAVMMLASLPLVALWAGVAVEAPDPGLIIRKGALAIAGMIGLVLIGRVLLPRLLSQAGRVGGEVLIVVSAAVALGAAVFTALLGFSPELGAFLAGFLLAGTPFRFQVAGQLVPLRDLFLAVLFTIVGMSVPILTVMGGWWILLLALIALGVVKVLGVTVVSWALGATPRVGLLAAVTLAPAGEFTLVMLAQSRQAGVLNDTQVGYATAVVGLSLIAAPLILKAGHAVRFLDRAPAAPWIRSSMLGASAPALASSEAEAGQRPFRAIVAGFGPVGRAVADLLARDGVDVTVIEMNPKTVQKQTSLGRRIVYGDASNPSVLESAGLECADAVVLTLPDDEVVLRSCTMIRAHNPGVFIAVRTGALSLGLRAMQLGADHAVVEEMVTAEAMSRQVLDKVRLRRHGEDVGPKLYEYGELHR
ncbi:Glutathione-regulated potassium-efflux system protein KefC [Phycisphaerales bacterium]|nr:Glutathione-regulated potassium-efflux system protein KefC [Phycisphaerales bacterium]